jgi:hypothetical protein
MLKKNKWLTESCSRKRTIGGHSLRYPWSAISDWAWYRKVRYRTEELNVRHYIGYRNKLLSNIRYPTLLFGNPRSAVVSCLPLLMKVVNSKPVRKIMYQVYLLGSIGNDLSILDIGISDIDLVRYRNGSWCRYRNYSDIRIKGFSPTFFVPISEWEMSMSNVGYRRHQGRCRCPPMKRTN